MSNSIDKTYGLDNQDNTKIIIYQDNHPEAIKAQLIATGFSPENIRIATPEERKRKQNYGDQNTEE